MTKTYEQKAGEASLRGNKGYPHSPKKKVEVTSPWENKDGAGLTFDEYQRQVELAKELEPKDIGNDEEDDKGFRI